MLPPSSAPCVLQTLSSMLSPGRFSHCILLLSAELGFGRSFGAVGCRAAIRQSFWFGLEALAVAVGLRSSVGCCDVLSLTTFALDPSPENTLCAVLCCAVL